MSLNKVKQVKQDRGFKPADLIIYAAIALIAAAVFMAVFFTRDNSPFTGFKVYVGSAEVFTYNFSKGEYAAPQTEAARVTVQNDGGNLAVRVELREGGYNVIYVDTSAKSVRVTEADCARRDCVYTPAVADNNGVIYCSPHRLKILPFDFQVVPSEDIIV